MKSKLQNYKLSPLNPPRPISLFLLLATLTLAACNSQNDSTSDSDNVSFKTPDILNKLNQTAGTLSATISCSDGDQPMEIIGDIASATCSKVPTGDFSFTIVYTFDKDPYGPLIVASATKTIAVTEGSNNSVNFVVGDFDTDFDEDGDNLSNLKELTDGTSPLDPTPVADAGPDQTVMPGDTVFLDGSGSPSSAANPLTFSWSLISVPTGTTARLSNATTVSPTLVTDLAGTYIVELIVNDGTLDSAPDTVVIDTTTSGVALFANTSYVDYIPADANAGASNLGAMLTDNDLMVETFTGITASDLSAAVSGRVALVIPALKSDLNAALDLGGAASTVIRDFVEDGGTLVTSASSTGYNVGLINAAFGINISQQTTAVVTSSPLNTTGVAGNTGAAGTRFVGGPTSLEANAGIYGVSLPDVAGLTDYYRFIYTDASLYGVVVLIPIGSGQIVIMGWDWSNAQPTGANDGGWQDVLVNAANLSRPLPDVALVEAFSDVFDGGTRSTDVLAKLHGTGHFNTISVFDASIATPSLATLHSYDSILVSANINFSDSTQLGNDLADYVDGEGGVVLTLFPSYVSSPTGRFEGVAMDYFAIPPGSAPLSTASQLTLGTIHEPAHDISNGVTRFNGGTISFRPATQQIVTGATRIADWSDNTPLVAVREDKAARRADLGFYPPSSDAITDGWRATTNGDKLMANALTWVADLPKSNISTDTFPITIPEGAMSPGITSVINLSDAPISISKVTVTLEITHEITRDLEIYLTSPGGTKITLASRSGSFGDNYANTTFVDAATTSISMGEAPFPGSYMPVEPLGNFTGENANGIWTLLVKDVDVDAIGAIDGWSLTIR